MEEIVSRLEKVADKLTGGKTYVYVLEEHENYDGIRNIIGCFDDSEKAWKAAYAIMDWLSISLDDIEKLGDGCSIESDDIGNRSVKVYRFSVK